MKRNSIKQRVFAAVLAASMVFTLMPSSAFAQNSDANEESSSTSSDRYEEIKISNTDLNGNAIRGNGENQYAAEMDNSAHFYSTDIDDDGGLPVDGKITMPESKVPYYLATGDDETKAYDGNDCIRLTADARESTMNLETIGVYDKVYVLATAGGPGEGNYADFKVTLNYTDDTAKETQYKLYDWYDTRDVDGVEKYYNVKRINNGYTDPNGSTTGAPILHSAAINVDKSKLLKSITFTMNGKNGHSEDMDNLYCCIFAVTGATPDGAPGRPVARSATSTGQKGFTANWKEVEGATGYLVDVSKYQDFRDDNGTSSFVDGYNNCAVEGGETTSLVVTGLEATKDYYYRVRAKNDKGQSLSSNVIKVTTVPHDHAWTYEQNGTNSVKAYCSNTSNKERCDNQEGNPLSLTITAADKTYTGKAYDGVKVVNNITDANGEEASDIEYYKDGTKLESVPVEVGSYTAKVSIDKLTAEADFKITKATVNLGLSIANWEVDGSASVPKVTENDINAPVKYYYKKRDSYDSEYKEIKDFTELKTLSIGEYTLKACIEETANYNGCEQTCNFEVTKKRVRIYFYMEGWTYGETANEPYFFEDSDLGNGEVTYTYYKNYWNKELTSAEDGAAEPGAVPKYAGDYYVGVSVAETDRYTAGSDYTMFTIRKKSLNAKATAEDKTYDGTNDATVNASINDNDLVAGDSVTVSGVTGHFENATAGTNKTVTVDENSMQLSGTGDRNYAVRIDNTSALTASIMPRVAELVWDETYFVYDGKEHTTKANVSNAIAGDMFNLTYEGNAQTKIGNYTARVTDLGNDNYKLPEDAATAWTIGKKKMIVKANGYTGVYDGEEHGITINVDEPANDNRSNTKILYGTKNDDGTITYTESPITYKNAGEYDVYYKITDDNYADETGSAKVEIEPKSVNLVWSDTVFTYDGKSHKPVANVSQDDLIGSDTSAVTVSGEQINAGSDYIARATALSNSNYKLNTNVEKDFSIQPAKATLIVDNATKHIGKADPEFTYKVTGLVEGDTLGGITFTREDGEAAGDYEITAVETAGSNPNYNIIEIKNGKLTIEDHIAVTDSAVAPTCTKTGLTEGSRCEVCNEVLVAQEVVAELGHEWSEWTSDGIREKSTCSRCNQVRYRNLEVSDAGKIEKDAEIADGASIAEATLDNSKAQLEEASGIFTQDEKNEIESGATARVWLEISATNNISDADTKKVESEAKEIMGSDISKIVYFNADLFKSVTRAGTTAKTQIAEPGIDIEVSIALPSEMYQGDSTIARAYKIIRLHNGIVDSFDADFDSDSGMLKFKTDRFSTYAIAFTDTQLAASASISSQADKNTLTSVGDTVQLTATILPENTADKSVTWTSSDSTVATVDETGKVTAVANGTVTITATTANGVKTTFTITVSIAAQPSTSDNPVQPSTPDNPAQPSTPDNPAQPSTPSASVTPAAQPDTTPSASEDGTGADKADKTKKAKGPDAPAKSGLKVEAPTVNGGSNGTISGVNSKMEYSTDGGKTWKSVKGNKITGLKAGQVRIRIKETAKRKAGRIAVITVPEGKYPNKEQIRRNSVSLISNASAKWTKQNYLKLRWGRVKDADGYEVYLRKCDGVNIYKKVAYNVTNSKQTTMLVKELDGEKFISTFNYKYAVKAYKKINGKKVYIGKTLTYHFIGSGNKWNTNPESVTVKNAKIILGVKKSTTLSAVVTKVDATLALMDHESEIRYVSSNPKIAKVDMKTGKVTGLKKGKCIIYCIAINGVSTKVEVTIK